MAATNSVGNSLTGLTGTGSFVGSASPTITTPQIGQINDANGSAILGFNTNASAVNYIAIGNNSSGSGPGIAAAGADTNIPLYLLSKGNSPVILAPAGNSIVINTLNFTYANQLSFPVTSNRTYAFPDASGTLLMTGQAISTVPSIAFSSTSGVIGTTTNDNAAAGSVGEYASTLVPVASQVSITDTVAANIATLSLSAGDWDVWGQLTFNPSAGVTTTLVSGNVGITSASYTAVPSDNNSYSAFYYISSVSNGATIPMGQARISISGTTTVYLVARAFFTGGTCAAYGKICARRAR